MQMALTLSEGEVKEILKEHLSKKLNVIGDVDLEVGYEYRGYGTNEDKVIAFKGAKCMVEVRLDG